jgi:hypothetical protein
MSLHSANRIERPSDIIYFQVARPFNTPEPQEEDSWDLAANVTKEKESAHVAVNIEIKNSSSVSDSAIDNFSASDSDSDSDSASISTSSTHTQKGNTFPHTASAAAANRMVATVPVNALAGQPQHDFSANTFLIRSSSFIALASLGSTIVCTLGAMKMVPTDSGKPLSRDELFAYQFGIGMSVLMMLTSTGVLIKCIVDRLRTNS